MTRAGSHSREMRASAALLTIAAALALIHVVSAFVVDSPAATLVFGGVVLAAGGWAYRRPGRAPLLVLLGLFLLEILALFSYAHGDLLEVILQVGIFALSLIGAVVAVRAVIKLSRTG